MNTTKVKMMEIFLLSELMFFEENLRNKRRNEWQRVYAHKLVRQSKMGLKRNGQ